MTTPTITHRIQYDRTTRDYACYVQVGGDPEQYIGSAATYHEGETTCLAYRRDLLSSDVFRTATALDGICGDCGQALDSMGLCGCQTEQEPTPEQQAQRDAEQEADMDEWLRESDVTHRPIGECYVCGAAAWTADNHGPLCPGHDSDFGLLPDLDLKSIEVPALDRPPPRIFCICGQPALIIEPHGTFCGACHEASDLWRLWKEDSTEFVAELRRQRCRLTEMAVRLATYLNAKNGSTLGTDSILTMWRQLLDDGDDGDDPGPRFYVVAARQQVAA